MLLTAGKIETQTTPIGHVAELIGSGLPSWFLSCDPLAIAMTAAASAQRRTAV